MFKNFQTKYKEYNEKLIFKWNFQDGNIFVFKKKNNNLIK